MDNASISSNLSLEHIFDINQDKIYKIKGMIVKDLKRISLYEACANCNRKIESCNCGKKTPPVPRIILNGIVDDESQSIRVTWMGLKAEEFLNDTAVNIKEIQNKGEIDEYLKQKSTMLVGKEYVMTGRAKFSQYSNGYEFNIITFEEVDPEKESRALIQQLNEG
jgi:hypothetical protein